MAEYKQIYKYQKNVMYACNQCKHRHSPYKRSLQECK